MRGAIDRRHDQLGQGLADRIGARMAEDAGGGVVELDDAAGLVDADDGVERGVEDGAHAGLAGAQVDLHVLAVGDVAQRADQAGGGAVLVDDQAADHHPALLLGGAAPLGCPEPRLELELAPPLGHAVRQVFAPDHGVLRPQLPRERLGRGEGAFRQAEDFVEPRREIGAVLGQVPVPQAVIGAACRQGIALAAVAQRLVGRRALDRAADQGGGGLQHVDLERVPDPLLLAIVEPEEAPDAGAQHDGDGDEALGAVLEEGLAGLAGHLVQRRLHDLAALARQRPVVQLALRLLERDVVVARIVAELGIAGLGPIVAAAFHRLAVRPLVELEQGDAADVGGAAEAVQQLLDADPPVGDADDLRRGVGDGVQHGGAARQLRQRRGGVDRLVNWKCPVIQPAAWTRQKPWPKAGNNTGRSLNDL